MAYESARSEQGEKSVANRMRPMRTGLVTGLVATVHPLVQQAVSSLPYSPDAGAVSDKHRG